MASSSFLISEATRPVFASQGGKNLTAPRPRKRSTCTLVSAGSEAISSSNTGRCALQERDESQYEDIDRESSYSVESIRLVSMARRE